MKSKITALKKCCVTAVLAPAFLALAMISFPAQAVPVQGMVLSGGNFSVVHTGATPGGSGNANDWLWFDSGQTIVMDLTGNDLSLMGQQSFNLQDGNGNTSSLLITGLTLNFDDPADGFSGGTLEYVLDGATAGTITFENQNYNSIFNSSELVGSNLEFYVWGGDAQNNLGIDLGISGLVSAISDDEVSQVPLPTAAWLFGSALLGLGTVKRRQQQLKA